MFNAGDYGQFHGRTDARRRDRRAGPGRSRGRGRVVSPVWWLSLPAMLKGWFDRVWSNGWAYEWAHDPEGSLLAPRPFVFLLTAAGSAATWARYGYGAALDATLRIGLLGWCGAGSSTVAILHDTGFDEDAMREHGGYAGRLGTGDLRRRRAGTGARKRDGSGRRSGDRAPRPRVLDRRGAL